MADQPRMTPPKWLNRLMCFMLRTPGVQHLVGRSTALLTFVSRKSGRSYTTPISYSLSGERAILTCHESRQWWRNLESNPRVQLRLAGDDLAGLAALPLFLEFLRDQRMIAKAAGISFENGAPNQEEAAAALQNTVVVSVALDR